MFSQKLRFSGLELTGTVSYQSEMTNLKFSFRYLQLYDLLNYNHNYQRIIIIEIFLLKTVIDPMHSNIKQRFILA